MNDVELEMNRDLALEIIMDNIALLTKQYSITQDKEESLKLKQKLDVLNKIKEELYLANEEIINKVITKRKKGML